MFDITSFLSVLLFFFSLTVTSFLFILVRGKHQTHMHPDPVWFRFKSENFRAFRFKISEKENIFIIIHKHHCFLSAFKNLWNNRVSAWLKCRFDCEVLAAPTHESQHHFAQIKNYRNHQQKATQKGKLRPTKIEFLIFYSSALFIDRFWYSTRLSSFYFILILIWKSIKVFSKVIKPHCPTRS